MSTTDLLDAPITPRDWQALAWERMRDVRAKHHGWSLDDALAHRIIGQVVRAFALQLQRQAQREAERQARGYGRQVVFNGYGHVPRSPR